MSALERLRALLCEQDGLMAGLMVDTVPADSRANGSGALGFAQLGASGPRTRAQAAEYELLLEAIYEGYLLHYGAPRLLRLSDADLGLLVGDRLYALGLAQLVALGDVLAVAELSDVITLTALAHGAQREDLAGAVWAAGVRAVGWGPSEAHGRAKELARAGDAEALAAMRRAAGFDER